MLPTNKEIKQKIKREKKSIIRDIITKVLHSSPEFHTTATETIVREISLQLYYDSTLITLFIDIIQQFVNVDEFAYLITLSKYFDKDTDDFNSYQREVISIINWYLENQGTISGTDNPYTLYYEIQKLNRLKEHNIFMSYFFMFYLKGSTSMRYLLKIYEQEKQLQFTDEELKKKIGKYSDWDFNVTINPWLYTGPLEFNPADGTPIAIIDTNYHQNHGKPYWTTIYETIVITLDKILASEATLAAIDNILYNVFTNETRREINKTGADAQHRFFVLGSWENWRNGLKEIPRNIYPEHIPKDFHNEKLFIDQQFEEDERYKNTNSIFTTLHTFEFTNQWGFTLFRLLNTFPTLAIPSKDQVLITVNNREILVDDLSPYLFRATSEHIDISVILPTTYRWQRDSDDPRGLGHKIIDIANCSDYLPQNECKEWRKKWLDPSIEGTNISNVEFFEVWEHTINAIPYMLEHTQKDGLKLEIPLYITSIHGILEDIHLTMKERGISDKKTPSRIRRAKLFSQLLCINRNVMENFLHKHQPTKPGKNVIESLNHICLQSINNIICSRMDNESQYIPTEYWKHIGPELRGLDINEYSQLEQHFILDLIQKYHITNIFDLLYFSIRELNSVTITYYYTDGTRRVFILNEINEKDYDIIYEIINSLDEYECCIFFSNLLREFSSFKQTENTYMMSTILHTFETMLMVYYNEKDLFEKGPISFIEAFRYMIYFYDTQINYLFIKNLINIVGEDIHNIIISELIPIATIDLFSIELVQGSISMHLVNNISWTNIISYNVHTFNNNDFKSVIQQITYICESFLLENIYTIISNTFSEDVRFTNAEPFITSTRDSNDTHKIRIHYNIPNVDPHIQGIESKRDIILLSITIIDHSSSSSPMDSSQWWDINKNIYQIHESGTFIYKSVERLIYEQALYMNNNLSILHKIKYDKALKQLVYNYYDTNKRTFFKTLNNILSRICEEQGEDSDCIDTTIFDEFENRGYNTYKFIDTVNNQDIITLFLNLLNNTDDMYYNRGRVIHFNEEILVPFSEDPFYPYDIQR